MACGSIVAYFIKILKCNMHFLFPYGMRILGMFTTYNLRLKQNQKWMMRNHQGIKQQYWYLLQKKTTPQKISSVSMSPDIKPPSKKQIVGCKITLVNPSRGDISRELQLFHNYIDLQEYSSYHFNIPGEIPQLYERD